MTSTSPAAVERPAERRIWLLISAACLVPAALGVFQAYMQARISGDSPRWQDLAFEGGEWLFLGALLPITYHLGKRFPFRSVQWKRSLIVHLAGALALCVAWATLGLLLGLVLDRYPAMGNFPRDYLSWILISIPWSVFMYFTVLGCVHAVAYFNEAREREAHAARLATQLAEARLGALRMQMHPHFLFNSLNAVGVLVRDRNTVAATRMLERLGDVLRQVLRTDLPHEVTLADELEFLAQYLAIEQERFSDRLRVHWSVEERARTALVPSFVLQPIVENAIKHGIAKRADAGRIDITARIVDRYVELSVRDDGVGMSTADVAEGVGLSNTRERLRTLYGNEAALTLKKSPTGGMEVTVRIPLRERIS